MATIGQQFKAAREAKGLSETEAGAATKILTKVICAMEADDFSAMAAPTYAKGFIRLYAGFLDLDPEPLVQEYLQNHATGPRPLLDQSSQLEQNSRPSVSVNLQNIFVKIPAGALLEKVKAFFGRSWRALPGKAWKDIRVLAGAVAAIFIVIILIVSLSNCARRRAAEQPDAPAPQVAPARSLLDEPIPNLYLVEPGKFETN